MFPDRLSFSFSSHQSELATTIDIYTCTVVPQFLDPGYQVKLDIWMSKSSEFIAVWILSVRISNHLNKKCPDIESDSKTALQIGE